jgi:hypothetical protein
MRQYGIAGGMEGFAAAVGAQIAGLRHQERLTVEDLAGRLRCPVEWLRQVEVGAVPLLFEDACGIADALGVRIGCLTPAPAGVDPGVQRVTAVVAALRPETQRALVRLLTGLLQMPEQGCR